MSFSQELKMQNQDAFILLNQDAKDSAKLLLDS